MINIIIILLSKKYLHPQKPIYKVITYFQINHFIYLNVYFSYDNLMKILMQIGNYNLQNCIYKEK